MPKTLTAEPSQNTINPALLALKARQLLISRPAMAKESKTLSLESKQKTLLLRSIARYLERCGFSKCFKKLLSEAEIEKKELNSTLPDLEEIYSEFLKKSHVEAVEVKDESGDDEEKKAGNVDDDHETNTKEKNKEVAEVSAMEGVEKAKKEKKKKKKEPKLEVTDEKVKETNTEIEDGVKEKKKKKNKSKSIEAESLGDEEKVSKKRKRSEPKETKEQTEDDEEFKRRKKEENVAEDDMAVQETPVKQTDVQENGNVEKSETKSTDKKSGKGPSNSKEPKKPFQRINVEEVVFTNDRLKDNSYWAKDGADSGYGAKAQEVLGQVRGRGFRHEKTKKKRGSYRGGEIDLQSHSVKFEYSDGE